VKRLVAVLLAFLAIAPAARAATTPTIWNGAGVFVADPRNLPGPWGLADSLAASGFTWVALELHDGTHALPVDPMWVETLREHGLAVGGWGVERTRPVAEAGVATRLVARFGLDFYIANAEAPYKADIGRWIRSSQFTTAFRALAPTLPAALATYGAATGRNVLPIDFAAWRRAGFDLLPEAYYNQFREYRPDLTVAHALRAGWPLDRVHPIVGVYRRYPAGRYVPLLRRAGTIGFSVFLADQARRSDYLALGRAIAAGAASAPFRAPPLSL
jgi:hypothetical protein